MKTPGENVVCDIVDTARQNSNRFSCRLNAHGIQYRRLCRPAAGTGVVLLREDVASGLCSSNERMRDTPRVRRRLDHNNRHRDHVLGPNLRAWLGPPDTVRPSPRTRCALLPGRLPPGARCNAAIWPAGAPP